MFATNRIASVQSAADVYTGRTHDVRVWAASLSNMTDATCAMLSSPCSPAEIERSQSFVFERDRRAYLTAHGLLRHALSNYDPSCGPSDWQFHTGCHGRPELANARPTRLRFNLSHCATRVACVICTELDCGIDVEPTPREASGAMVRRCLSTAEQGWVDSAAPELRGERFLQLWTLKEAVTKAVGLGLALPFAALDLDLHGAPVLRHGPAEVAGPWWLALRRSADDHFDAVALRVPDRDAVAVVNMEWAA